MFRIIKLFFLLVIFVVFVAIGLHFFLVYKGKEILVNYLEKLFQQPVTVEYLGLVIPLNLKIENLKIDNLVSIDEIFISPNPWGIFRKRIVFNSVKIINPKLKWEIKNVISSPSLKNIEKSHREKSIPVLNLFFRRIKVRNGEIEIRDMKTQSEPIKFMLKEINFSISNLYLMPRSNITDFNFQGKFIWNNNKEGLITFFGWVNLYKKDINARLEVKDIDGIHFYPYYRKWVDLEKARIKRAQLNFFADLLGLNNDLSINYRLELTEIERRPLEPGETEEKASKIADAVIGILRTLDKDKIVLNGTIKTKFDQPIFVFDDFKLAFEEKITQAYKNKDEIMQNLMKLPRNLFVGTIESVSEISRALIESFIGVGKGIKEIFLFSNATKKREKQEKEINITK